MDDKTTEELHSCGYPEDSFACKIRHLHINTGDAKAGSEVHISPNGRVIR